MSCSGWCPRPELNWDPAFRKRLLYPFELRGLLTKVSTKFEDLNMPKFYLALHIHFLSRKSLHDFKDGALALIPRPLGQA